MNDDLYLISDIAKRLDVPPHRIAYLYMRRTLVEPLRIGNRRMFSDSDAIKIAEALGKTWSPIKGDREK